MILRKRGLLLALSAYLLFGLWGIFSLAGSLRIPEPDMVAVNRILNSVTEHWPEPQGIGDSPYRYSVAGPDGAILYRTDEQAPSSIRDAVASNGIVLDVEENGVLYGKVLIFTGYSEFAREMKTRVVCICALFLLLPPALLLGFLFYVNQSILKPFREMRGFARHVAAGNLDVPLPMDRRHAFGAFTESFDLMREQLKEARLKEAEANRSKRELTASLSHDIKTPVSAIRLVTELLLVKEPAGARRDRLQTIYEKSGQIDRLATNLLSASLEDLGELKVQLSEESSSLLEPMIRRADYLGKVSVEPIPGCILKMDPLRMEQVIGNLVSNSYKYAATSITVRSEVVKDSLRLELKDYGKGVPDEELPLIFQMYFRGSRQAGTAEGSGLGLPICRRLMEKMGGGIECLNREDGFSAVLYIRLA